MHGLRKVLPLVIAQTIIVGAIPVCAQDSQVRLKPLPAIVRAKVETLAPAYDWITRERIRGMYCYAGQFKDRELIQSISSSKLNSILLHVMGRAMSEAVWPEEVAAWAQIQKLHNLHVIVSWPFGSDEVYSNTQFGAYDTGTPSRFSHTPCPLSNAYWDRVVGDRALIAARGGLTGLIVDMEMYGADQTWYGAPCHCDTCWSRFHREFGDGVEGLSIPATQRSAWATRHGIASEYGQWQEMAITEILREIRRKVRAVNPDFLLGYLHSIEPLRGLARGLGTSDMPALIFGEREYKGADDGWYNVSQFTDRIKALETQGYPALYITGLWLKHVKPQDLPQRVETYGAPCAGYWVWSSAAFAAGSSGDNAFATGCTAQEYWQAFQSVNTRLNTD